MMSLAIDAACAAASVLKGDCDWPLPAAPLFFTYQTRFARFSVTVPVACVGVPVPPVFEVIVLLKGDCDWPLPAAPLFFTYQTRFARFSVTVPVACVGVPVPPVFEVIV